MLTRPGWKVVKAVIVQATLLGFCPPDNSVPCEFLDLSVEFVDAIIANHLKYIDANGLGFLMDIVYKFASSKSDISTSTLSLELFHRIASHFSSVKATEDKFLELWRSLLVHLKELGCDERAEVRAKVFETLQEIFRANASRTPLKVWSCFFFEVLPQLVQVVEVNFLMSRDDSKGCGVPVASAHNLPTPTFQSLHHFNVNAEKTEVGMLQKESNNIKAHMKEWEESVAALLTTWAKILHAFQHLAEGKEAKEEMLKKAWDVMMEVYTRVVKTGTYKIVCVVLKVVNEWLGSFREVVKSYLEDVWELVKGVKVWIEMKYQAERNDKVHIGSKIAPAIIKTLENLFNKNDELDSKIMLEQYNLLFTVLA